jgi:secreted PhoX family phosphatase
MAVRLNRRAFLRSGAGVAVGAGIGAGPFAGMAAHASGPPSGATLPQPVLGPVADLRDGVVRLWLPPGFQYRSFDDNGAGAKLSNGTTIPGRHDGMAAFPGKDGLVHLVRNHEVNGPGAAFASGAPTYDPKARGGTTTTVVDNRGNVVSGIASLVGTQMNCAGGRTPWGTWITCEETVNGPDVFDDFTRGTLPPNTYVQNAQLTKPHGYIFEVDAYGVGNPEPIRSAGRFAHEAMAYDPYPGYVYLTEDNFGYPSLFYKYVPPEHPDRAGRLLDGGELYALAVVGKPNIDLSARYPVGTRFPVTFMKIEDPDPSFPMTGGLPTVINDDAINYVGAQGRASGAAYFSRLEGATYDFNTIYFCSTQGGGDPEDPDVSVARSAGYGKGYGQIWAYHVDRLELELVYQSPGRGVLDFPDNVTLTGRGNLVLCEDSTDFNYLRLLSPDGQLRDFAVNQIAGRTNEEVAGATFSPDFQTLYVNIQASAGLSMAIWGPWETIGA